VVQSAAPLVLGLPCTDKLSGYVSICLSPLNPPILGDFERFLFSCPPELGARGRLIVDLTRFYDLCIHGKILVVPCARISPSKVQQEWFRIISHLGIPSVPPQPRGFSSGRKSGQTQSPRPPLPVIKKGKPKIHKPDVAA
jgi:hypothetical protein